MLLSSNTVDEEQPDEKTPLKDNDGSPERRSAREAFYHTTVRAAVQCKLTHTHYEAGTLPNKIAFPVKHTTKYREVRLSAADYAAFAEETPFTVAVPPETAQDIRVHVSLPLEKGLLGKELKAEPVRLGDALGSHDGKIVAFLQDENENYCGRVHLLAEYDSEEKILQISIRHVSQLRLSEYDDEYTTMVNNMVLGLAMVIFVAAGMLFFTLYVQASVVDSLLFISSLFVVTGLLDIADNPATDKNGHAIYDKEILRIFLIFYMIIGVLVLFKCASVWFNALIKAMVKGIRISGIFGNVDPCFQKNCPKLGRMLPPITTRAAILVIAIFYFMNVLVLRLSENFTWMEAAYFTTNLMTTVGFVTDVSIEKNSTKIYLAIFGPFCTMLFFFFLSQQTEEGANRIKEERRQAVLHGLLSEPEDMIAVAGDTGYVSKFDYLKHVMLTCGNVEVDEMHAIEQRFNMLDLNKDGKIDIDELMPENREDEVVCMHSRSGTMIVEEDSPSTMQTAKEVPSNKTPTKSKMAYSANKLKHASSFSAALAGRKRMNLSNPNTARDERKSYTAVAESIERTVTSPEPTLADGVSNPLQADSASCNF